MIKAQLHQHIVRRYDKARSWFEGKAGGLSFPFYSSFDLRDSSIKASPVDANLFPAGFNNICEVDKQNAVFLCKKYLNTHFSSAQNVILLTEEHTQNPFYWDNIHALKTLLEKSGLRFVYVCVPGKNITKNKTLISARGYSIKVFLLKNKIHTADLIISNNDFSVNYHLAPSTPITPPLSAGWRTRRKHSFFKEYNLLAKEFADLIQIEPEHLTIKTKRFKDFNPNNLECLERLKNEVDNFLSDLKKLYKVYKNNDQAPFVFLKNNSGTYGLGMTSISSAKDIDRWNYKIKKKMKAAKGGGAVNELIIQEGITSHLKKEGAVAEPVIYLIGSRLAGGFLRTHKEKGMRDNLNSPGAVYRTLCISDLEIEVEGKPMENVYGWIAHLSALALSYELKNLKNNP